MNRKNGKIQAGAFSRNDKEPFNAVQLMIEDEDHKVIVTIELTFEQYGKLLSGHGSVDMTYIKYPVGVV